MAVEGVVDELHRCQVFMGFSKNVVGTFHEVVGFCRVASADFETIGEPEIVHQDFSWLINRCINIDVHFEAFAVLHDTLVNNVALRISGVWSREGFELSILEAAVLVPEALRFVTSRCSQIFVGFELPVGPS